MRILLLFVIVIVIAAAASAADAPPSTTRPTVEVSTPDLPQLRSVSPEEVRQKYEELLKEKSGEAAAARPTVQSAPSPAEPTPLAFVPKSTPGAIPTPALPPVAFTRSTPDTGGAPMWEPVWRRAQLGYSERGDLADVELDYQWEGVLASVRLVPSSLAAPPVRVFFRQATKETLQILPGRYRLEVDLWLPGDIAPFSVYRFEGQDIERGQTNSLAFPPELTKDLRMHLVMAKEREAKSFRLPTVTPRVVNVPLSEAGLTP